MYEYVCIYVCAYVCMCMCTYVYVCMCICVCMSMCVSSVQYPVVVVVPYPVHEGKRGDEGGIPCTGRKGDERKEREERRKEWREKMKMRWNSLGRCCESRIGRLKPGEGVVCCVHRVTSIEVCARGKRGEGR